MTLEEGGVPSGFPYDSDRDGVRTKPQVHRPGQTFRLEGLWVTVNKQNPVRVTDYSPRNRATTVKTEAAAEATVIAVNSVKYFAKFAQVTFDRGGAAEETHYIIDIDATNNTITLQEGLTNLQAVSNAVDMDMIKVTNTDGRVCYIDIIMGGQSTTAALAGLDLQNARVRPKSSLGWNDADRFDGFIRVPYAVGGAIDAAIFCDECYELEGEEETIHDSHESASAIDPNYILRIVFTSAEATPTEKKLSFKFGVWRATW